MHLLAVSNVTASVDGRVLFSEATFGVEDQDRIAIVGPNGVGKSTLLRILAGVRQPDGGAVTMRSSAEVAYLSQDPTWPDASALAVVRANSAVTKHDAEAMLDRLGIEPTENTQAMSQGQRRRVALAQTLLQPADILILDEPTNHLDVPTIAWLEDHLRAIRNACIVVTHDRYFLERLATRMIDIDPQGRREKASVYVHDGPYSSLLAAREQRRRHDERSRARAQNLLRKEVAWLTRQPKARASKPKFRVEQADTLRTLAADGVADPPLELGSGRHRLGNEVVTLERVHIERGNKPVLSDVSLTIGPGERVGIVGPNGAGKTTLLELLSGQRLPTSGTVRIGATVVCGAYAQHITYDVDEGHQTVLEAIQTVGSHIPLASGETLPATRLAERFGFTDRLLTTRVGDLSGGERRRFALLHLLITAPNVLVFDEPTNDLDLDTLAALEDHLDGFSGTLIVASHDRYLLDRMTDRTLHVANGAVREVADPSDVMESTPSLDPSAHRREPTATARSNSERQDARRQLRALERQVTECDRAQEQLLTAMAQAATDPTRLLTLQSELAGIKQRRHEAENAWLALASVYEDVV